MSSSKCGLPKCCYDVDLTGKNCWEVPKGHGFCDKCSVGLTEECRYLTQQILEPVPLAAKDGQEETLEGWRRAAFYWSNRCLISEAINKNCKCNKAFGADS